MSSTITSDHCVDLDTQAHMWEIFIVTVNCLYKLTLDMMNVESGKFFNIVSDLDLLTYWGFDVKFLMKYVLEMKRDCLESLELDLVRLEMDNFKLCATCHEYARGISLINKYCKPDSKKSMRRIQMLCKVLYARFDNGDAKRKVVMRSLLLTQLYAQWAFEMRFLQLDSFVSSCELLSKFDIPRYYESPAFHDEQPPQEFLPPRGVLKKLKKRIAEKLDCSMTVEEDMEYEALLLTKRSRVMKAGAPKAQFISYNLGDGTLVIENYVP